MKPPSSLCLPPCQGRPEPVAVTEDRLLHILLFAQSLGALRSGTGATWDEAALGNAAWSSLCCWCLWVLSPPSSKAGRLSPRDPPWHAASRKGALQPLPSALGPPLLYTPRPLSYFRLLFAKAQVKCHTHPCCKRCPIAQVPPSSMWQADRWMSWSHRILGEVTLNQPAACEVYRCGTDVVLQIRKVYRCGTDVVQMWYGCGTLHPLQMDMATVSALLFQGPRWWLL